MKKLSLSIVTLLMCYAFSYGQEKVKPEPYKNWEIGINAGVANFSGEYNMFKDARFNHFNHWKSDMNIGYGALVRKNFSHVFAVEAAWNKSKLKGSWNFNDRLMPDFETHVNEFNLNTAWNINNLFSKKKFNRKIYWYAKIGLGATHLKDIVAATPLKDQNWKFLTVPLGTGVAFRLGDNMKLNVGTQWSWVNTDRLDGRKEEIGGNPPNVEPGNTENDVYGTQLYSHVGISYTFGKKKKPVPVVVVVPEPEPAPAPAPVPEPKPVPKPEPVPEVIFVQPAVVGNVYNIQFGLNFGFDKWNLDGQSSAELDRLVKDMTDNPTVDVEIKSHTDSQGAASYNMTLSEKRGKSVRDYLVSKGISGSRIHTTSFGETQLLNKCADGVPCTKAEHAVNRRSEATDRKSVV